MVILSNLYLTSKARVSYLDILSNEFSIRRGVRQGCPLSRDLQVFPIAGFCASFQIKCFRKWRNSKCIIKDLINHIPSISRYSWSKKTLVLYKKIKKNNITKFKDFIELYWSDVGKFQGIIGMNYDNFKFINTRNFIQAQP